MPICFCQLRGICTVKVPLQHAVHQQHRPPQAPKHFLHKLRRSQSHQPLTFSRSSCSGSRLLSLSRQAPATEKSSCTSPGLASTASPQKVSSDSVARDEASVANRGEIDTALVNCRRSAGRSCGCCCCSTGSLSCPGASWPTPHNNGSWPAGEQLPCRGGCWAAFAPAAAVLQAAAAGLQAATDGDQSNERRPRGWPALLWSQAASAVSSAASRTRPAPSAATAAAPAPDAKGSSALLEVADLVPATPSAAVATAAGP